MGGQHEYGYWYTPVKICLVTLAPLIVTDMFSGVNIYPVLLGVIV